MNNINLGEAKVLVTDPQMHSRRLLRDALNMIGFRKIELTSTARDMRIEFVRQAPSLLFVDLDGEREAVCALMRDIRDRKVGHDSFVAIIGLTWSPDEAVVTAALAAGIDDMVAKPVSPKLLRDRTINIINHRRDFVVTHDYTGPDRRSPGREPTANDLPTVAVPNALRYVTTGDDSAVDPELIAKTVRSLCTQKVYRLATEITDVAEQLRGHKNEANSVDPSGPVARITQMLDQIETLVAEQKFDHIKQLTENTRQVLDGLVEAQGKASANQFELLHLNAQGMALSLRESDKAAGALVLALREAKEAVSQDAHAA